MKKYEGIKNELDNLALLGEKLYKGLLVYKKEATLTNLKENQLKDLSFFYSNYEKWYSKSLLVIKQLLPSRLADFTSLYKNGNRKEINWTNYTVSDALQHLNSNNGSMHPSYAQTRLRQQCDIVHACVDCLESRIYDIQTILQADIFDSEINSARHLLKMGFLRASGAICGVVLEKHLADVAIAHDIVIKKKAPTISDYIDAFKDNVYDTVEWRRMQRLGDLRNLCDHNKYREPTKDEVEELIGGTDRVLKTIF